MDTLTDVLNHIRSSGALLGRTLANPPWSATFAERASLSLVTMLRGEAWIVDGSASYRLEPHDIAIVVGPAAFDVTSDPDASPAPLYIQTEAGICLDDAGDTADSIGLGTRTCGTQLDADDAMLTGSFTVAGRVADRLLSALPRVVVVPRGAQRTAGLRLLEAEIAREEPGQQAVLDRLLDLVLVGALRDWFALPDVQAPGWYQAASDPVVGTALAAIHDTYDQPWTIELLARQAHVSRATLARRFTELLGEPPMSYLAGWRLCVAADLLERGDITVESVAREVGYSSAYALSAAFHREYGVRPSQYRRDIARRSELVAQAG
ncbi:AraC family transcriptional regulator [Saccharomonospora piscinae]|uniref:AraC family transcriptional regulator n=1 Tax=Saccharomonospora piscinae TaxID=687388 RepID=UPI001105837F|nr:AraC family transcriptional regulator [Saccharomonospora piscinae]TLW90683.1 AraC family transcriptional regulator [Saccharomonospora piscinae]